MDLLSASTVKPRLRQKWHCQLLDQELARHRCLIDERMDTGLHHVREAYVRVVRY